MAPPPTLTPTEDPVERAAAFGRSVLVEQDRRDRQSAPPAPRTRAFGRGARHAGTRARARGGDRRPFDTRARCRGGGGRRAGGGSIGALLRVRAAHGRGGPGPRTRRRLRPGARAKRPAGSVA